MIAKAIRGRAFSGLGRYPEAGRDGNAPKRVEWMEALRAAPRLETAGTAHLRAPRAAWDGRHEYRATHSNVRQLEQKVRELDAVLARSPGSAELKLRRATCTGFSPASDVPEHGSG